MPHAEHFLSRLVRLADDEVKLALTLYHDSRWVRHVLGSVSIPDTAERVALSLGDPRRGPFVVVTRDGHFVTCLARDMSPGQLTVVARDRLDVSGRKVGRERQRAALEERVQEGDTKLRTLLRRLFFEPDAISREDFLEVAAWEPLLGPAFFGDGRRAHGAESRPAPEAARAPGVQGRAARLLEPAARHRTRGLARGHDGRPGGYEALADELPGARAAFSYPLTGTGITTFMLKGAWAAGRMGKPMLAAYKRALAEDVALFELFDSLLVLLVLGRRSSKLRAEIKKAVSSAAGRATTSEARVLREQFGRDVELVCEVIVSLIDAPRDDLDDMLLRLGDSYFDGQVDLAIDDTARDIALTFPLMSWLDGITNGKNFIRTLNLAAAAAELRRSASTCHALP